MATRAVFAGTPDFAVPCLNALIAVGIDVVAVYTQPDRPAGRGRKLNACPVKRRAVEAGLQIRQPCTLADESEFLVGQKIDILFVAAYGLILPQQVLEIPTMGCINVHASLLPRWRGAAPIQRAIEAGDQQTGISLMRMDEGLDTGAVLATEKTLIQADETGLSLHNRLSAMGAGMLEKYYEALIDGSLESQAQPADGVTYARQLTRHESWIDWRRSASEIERCIRAFNPWPLTRSNHHDTPLIIRKACVGPDQELASPGTVIETQRDFIRVQTGEGTLDLIEIQKSGGTSLSVRAFQNGYSINAGDQLTSQVRQNANC
ncbi:methionyl-tRNA formyltransferase [Arenicellales bacterium IMCC55707]